MTGYGLPSDPASVLMASGHKVQLRPATPADRAEWVRMTDGTTRRMAWVVDERPVSRAQLEYAAARAASAHRAKQLLAQSPRRNAA